MVQLYRFLSFTKFPKLCKTPIGIREPWAGPKEDSSVFRTFHFVQEQSNLEYKLH